jgi:hypothetical protein
MQSYYLAESGLERAIYDITVNNLGCSSINGTANYTNATFPNAAGVFTVTGTPTQVNNTLNGNITAIVTTIPLTSTTGFSSSGSISIDSELINYTGTSGNNLTGAQRGIGGSTATTHNSGTVVNENQCILSSTGGVPSLSSPITKRVIQSTLIGSSFSPGQNSSGAGTGSGSSGGAGSGLYQTAIVIAGSVSLNNGTVVSNGTVTPTSGNFSGSTVMSGGPTVINGTGITQVSNNSGGLQTSSTSAAQLNDVMANSNKIVPGSLWSSFFSQPPGVVQAGANQTYNSSNINGATGQTIWTSDLSLNSNTTIGSPTSPVILIINGNLNSTAALTIYGLTYVMGSAALNGSNTSINGLFAIAGALNTNGSPVNINYNSGVLTKSASINPNSTQSFSIVPANSQEKFP